MNKLIISQQDTDIIEKQIKLQKKAILLFPLLTFCLVTAGTIRNYGQIPPFIINIIALVPMILIGLYSPLTKGILLSKTFYSIEIMDNNQVQFTAFGTLWREEKTITVDLKDIIIDTTPLPKLLYKKYVLNNIYIDNKKYYIFNTILNKSGIAAMANNKN